MQNPVPQRSTPAADLSYLQDQVPPDGLAFHIIPLQALSAFSF